jgi:hypothetical protein
MTMVTSQKTKSGTTIFVVGGAKQERNKALDYLLKFYNHNFTIGEQKTIGNIYYDLLAGTSKDSAGKHIAETGTFVGEMAKKMNPAKKKMVDLYVSKDGRTSEHTITHELLHAKKFMSGITGDKHNEREIDFEAVGRVSRSGLNYENMHGYYFSPSGNKTLAKKKIPIVEKGKIAHAGVLDDRRLLTGSLNTSIIGINAENKAKKLFPKSFFNRKKF